LNSGDASGRNTATGRILKDLPSTPGHLRGHNSDTLDPSDDTGNSIEECRNNNQRRSNREEDFYCL
jgi:hypothetical protein